MAEASTTSGMVGGAAYCARCARPIRWGSILRKGLVYCSVACALLASPASRSLRASPKDVVTAPGGDDGEVQGQ